MISVAIKYILFSYFIYYFFEFNYTNIEKNESIYKRIIGVLLNKTLILKVKKFENNRFSLLDVFVFLVTVTLNIIFI